jgi:hypothetical protein
LEVAAASAGIAAGTTAIVTRLHIPLRWALGAIFGVLLVSAGISFLYTNSPEVGLAALSGGFLSSIAVAFLISLFEQIFKAREKESKDKTKSESAP